MGNKIIWIFNSGEPIPYLTGARPMRTSCIINEFALRGHKVHWWTSRFNHQTKDYYKIVNNHEIINSVSYHFSWGLRYKKNNSVFRYISYKLSAIITFFDILKSHEKMPDLFYFSIPSYDLSALMSIYCRIKKIPYIIDVRDAWPTTFEHVLSSPLFAILKPLLLIDYFFLRLSIKGAAKVHASSPQLAAWVKELVPSSLVETHIHGYPSPFATLELAKNELINKPSAPGLNVVFVGTLGEMYDLELIIKLTKMCQKFQDIKFQVIGSGPKLQRFIRENSSLNNLKIFGRVESVELRKLLIDADIGLLFYKSNDFFPNKLFEYLAYGLTIISNIKNKDIDAISSSYIHCSSDINNLYKKIIFYYENKAILKRNSEAMLEIYYDRFCSKKVYTKLCEETLSIFGGDNGN